MITKDWKLNVSPEFELEGSDQLWYCDNCNAVMNHYSDLCNKCYSEMN